MAAKPKHELHPGWIDTRSRLAVPIDVLREANWKGGIGALVEVAFELMDFEGFCRLWPIEEYQSAVAGTDDPLEKTALEEIYVTSAFDKHGRLGVPPRVASFVLERMPIPGRILVRARDDCLELWSHDRALSELRQARVIAAKRLKDWTSYSEG